MINIELKPEYIANVFGLNITNTFLTTILVSIVLGIFSLIFFVFGKRRGFVGNILSVFVLELLRLIDTVTKDRELSKKLFPLIATFFVFIVTANLLALTPGFLGSFYVERPEGVVPLLRSPNSDLTTTLALAIFSVAAIQFFSIKILGLRGYLSRFFSLKNPLTFILGFFEMFSEGIKVISFSMRLFGNIFAGEVLLLVIAFLLPYIIPLPFMILEVFVGIIQAFIFAMLTLVFIKTSIMRHIPKKPLGRLSKKVVA